MTDITPPSTADPAVVVIGAGPAGLTAAYDLAKRGVAATVVEADGQVGGLSRTVVRDGWRFDIGGHRFFTKVPAVEALWHEILPDGDFLIRPRMSRIYYDGKFFDYPLRATNALRNLGPLEAARCVGSYVWARLRPPADQTTFEGWTAARFGWRLYRIFFKTYTEKVWGVPATEIQADWAAQRIKNLSLARAVANSVLPRRKQKEITSLIEEFQYPKYGPGMMWERSAGLVQAAGTKVLLNAPVVRIRHRDGAAYAVVVDTGGALTELQCTDVISSMPLSQLLLAMDPPVPKAVREAAGAIRHRDFLTIAVVVPAESGFPDNWIYVHSPSVRLGRIQNFGSWSPFLVKNGRTCLGLEYFVSEGDDLWTMDDDALVEMGSRELATLALVDPADVESGFVVRVPKAYPTYDEHYRDNVEVLKAWLAENAANVHPVGRNGMHKYNNQDHSMYTALLTVENILGADHDIWAVNVEEAYHEELDPDAAEAPDGPWSGARGAGNGGGSSTGREAPILRARQTGPRSSLSSRPTIPAHLTSTPDDPRGSEADHTAKIGDIAATAGIRRVHILAWRDLDDVDAGGSEIYVAEVARRWAQAGIEVTMRTSAAQHRPPVIQRDGYRVIRRGGRYLVFPRAVLSELARHDGPRDALVEIWIGVPFLSPLWHRGPRVAVLHHLHAEIWRMMQPPLRARIGEAIERRLAPPFYRGTRIVTLSDPSRDELIEELDLRPELVSVVSPGIDPRFRPGASKAPEPLVVAVGRLVPVKRFDLLIRAAAEARQAVPGLQLHIVGSGDGRQSLQDEIDRLHAGDWVVLRGRVSDDELISLYQRAWAVASTSKREGWGMSLTEAAACGTPGVATHNAGHVAALAAGETGLLVDDPAGMGAALRSILTDHDLRHRLGAAAVARSADLTWPAAALGLMRALAGEPAPSR